MSLSIIQEVAEPQTIRTMSRRAEAHPFQKCSKAEIKSEPTVSIQGSSSRKPPCVLLGTENRDKKSASQRHRANHGATKILSCHNDEVYKRSFQLFLSVSSCQSGCLENHFLLKIFTHEKRFPTLRRPHIATNSDCLDSYMRASVSCSLFLPIILFFISFSPALISYRLQR